MFTINNTIPDRPVLVATVPDRPVLVVAETNVVGLDALEWVDSGNRGYLTTQRGTNLNAA